MKTLIFNLVAVLVLFVLGCQENSVTDPLLTESADKIQLDDNYKHGTIDLQRMLKDPRPIGNSFYRVLGQIEYRISSGNAETNSEEHNLSVRLSVDADLQYFCSVCSPSYEDDLAGFLSEVSVENVAVAGNSVTLLEKTYRIEGRDDGMLLKFRFFVTTGEMKLSAVWLALENQSVNATNTY